VKPEREGRAGVLKYGSGARIHMVAAPLASESAPTFNAMEFSANHATARTGFYVLPCHDRVKASLVIRVLVTELQKGVFHGYLL
jgi:hypothetical protein